MKTHLIALLAGALVLSQVSCESPEDKTTAGNITAEEKQNAINELKTKNITPEQFDSKLIEAAKKGSITLVELLLKAGADVHTSDEKGNTPLIHAANRKKDNIKHLQALLSHGADINATNNKGTSPLLAAIANKNIEAVQFILNNGAILNAADEQGKKTVKYIAKSNNPEIAQLFIQRAIEQNDNVLLSSLIENGINITSLDCNSILQSAVRLDKVKIVQLLIDAGASPYEIIETKDGQKASLLNLASSENMKQLLKDKGCIEIVSLDQAVDLLIRYEIIDTAAAGEYKQKYDQRLNKVTYYDTTSSDVAKRFLYNYMLYKDGQKRLSDYSYVFDIYYLWYFKGKKKKHLPQECVLSFIAHGSKLGEGWFKDNLNDTLEKLYELDVAMYVNHWHIFEAILNAKNAKFNANSLSVAAHWGGTWYLKKMCQSPKVDVNALDDEGRTALMRSIRFPEYDSKNVRTIRQKILLATPGIDVNKLSENGESALARAASYRDIEAVKLLLAAPGIDVNAGKFNPITEANYMNNSDTIKLLLNAGVKVEYNAYSKALESNCSEILKLLITKGPNVNIKNKDGNTLLHLAVLNNQVDCVKVLLEAGADINITDKYGDTPLHIAIRKNPIDSVKLLLAAKPDVNIKDKYGDAPLHYAHIDLLKPLLEAGANVNLTDKNGNTPLHRAVLDCNANRVKVLLEGGANVNITNKDGNTPLHLAVRDLHDRTDRKINCVKALLEGGVNVNITNKDGDTPLHIAMRHFEDMRDDVFKVDCVKVFQESGANVNLTDKDGNTPLHLAARASYDVPEQCFELMLKAGADLNIKNNEGRYPYELASHPNKRAMIKPDMNKK